MAITRKVGETLFQGNYTFGRIFLKEKKGALHRNYMARSDFLLPLLVLSRKYLQWSNSTIWHTIYVFF
jgi:hypothetical protein